MISTGTRTATGRGHSGRGRVTSVHRAMTCKAPTPVDRPPPPPLVLTLQPQAMSPPPSNTTGPPPHGTHHSSAWNTLACSRGCPFPWSWLKCPASEASLGSWQYWLSTPHPLSTSPAHDLLLLLSCLTDGILSTAAASPASQKLVGA